MDIQRAEKLWGKKCNFGNFGAIFDPFDTPWLKNQNFPGVKGGLMHVYINVV